VIITHALKIECDWLLRLEAEEKTCEVRRHDRDFQAGDHIKLTCTSNRDHRHDSVEYRITHVLTHDAFPGVADGYCVLSLGRP
jgi:hypothetical protein